MAVRPLPTSKIARALLTSMAIAAVAACSGADIPKEAKPVPYALIATMQQRDMKETSQIFIRIFKESSELELWKQQRDGKFALLKTYEICRWSGNLGPKIKEGDRQAPEGFYTVTPGQMNPKSSYYLSFNIGYPNAFDRAHGRTGSNLMVHGACSSAGCYSMTDESAGELFALARDSFRGGQRDFQIQALPFRMTPENLARHAGDPNIDFWRMLKQGSDIFELTKVPPAVNVCDGRYVFNADAGGASFSPTAACPPYSQPATLVAALQAKQAKDEAAIATALAQLDAKALADAQATQLAAAKAAEAEQRAAERAANPSLMTQLLNRVGLGGQQPENLDTPTNVDVAPVSSVVPVSVPVQAAAPASVPAPRLRPEDEPAAPAAAVATTQTPAVAAEPATPSIGTFIKKKFLWPGEEEGASPPG